MMIKNSILVFLMFQLLCEAQEEDKSYSQCIKGEDCGNEVDMHDDDIMAEKTKYYRQKVMEYYTANTADPTKDITDEEYKEIITMLRNKEANKQTESNEDNAGAMLRKLSDNANSLADDNAGVTNDGIDSGEKLKNTEKIKTDANAEVTDKNQEQEASKTTQYKFPPLLRIKPDKEVAEVELEDGVFYKRITRSAKPVLFEIPDFLSADECNHIIEAAKRKGLNTSEVFGADLKKEYEAGKNMSDISRISDQTWLTPKDLGDFTNTLYKRVARLIELPFDVVQRSESLQVVNYAPGGHYHAHLDTTQHKDYLPCCFQTHCGNKSLTPQWAECCRLCRYITVMYYLNDVEAGGQTAFPLADMPEELYREKLVNIPGQEWYNLSRYCHNSSILVTPKRGTAVFWYSHFVDTETGYLGPVDSRSHHGGCDLLAGTKWIANTWISAPTYENRFIPSRFYSDP